MSCIQFTHGGWVLWRLIDHGADWWTAGRVRHWPPRWAWGRVTCPRWITTGPVVTLP